MVSLIGLNLASKRELDLLTQLLFSRFEIDCRFNVTAPKPIAGNSTAFKSMIHSGVIKNNDIPDALLNYTKDYNVTLQCIWNIAVMPGWKVSLFE